MFASPDMGVPLAVSWVDTTAIRTGIQTRSRPQAGLASIPVPAYSDAPAAPSSKQRAADRARNRAEHRQHKDHS